MAPDMEQTLTTHYRDVIKEIEQELGHHTEKHDLFDSFVIENYDLLKQKRLFSAAIPAELGGDGWTHADMCFFLHAIAQRCSATALAFSMHQHLVAANVWKYKKGQGGEPLLKRVSEQQLVLVSTGAGDWLASNGVMEKTDGGYLVTAQKHFASQLPAGNIIVTSARFENPEKGMEVLHFPVPAIAPGVSIRDNWYAMGMRGTGSQTVVLEKVFVPESAIVLRRPAGEYHPFWNVVLTVAMPLIMSVYMGIAEKATTIALTFVKENPDATLKALIGEMENCRTTAHLAWRDMIRITNNFDFEPIDKNGNDILVRKTIVANACRETVSKAMDVVGGRAFLRSNELERLFRDVQASRYHPLEEKAQHVFTGNYLTTTS